MAVSNLDFRARRGNSTPVDVSGGVVLRGEVEWIASGGSSEVAALLSAVGRMGDAASATAAILKFGNVVGRFDLGEIGFVQVQCGKLNESDFDAMLGELTRRLAALPFSATQAAGIPHDRSIADHDDVLLHAFLYARHILLAARGDDSLVRALGAVVRDPHRRFGAERAAVELHAASRIDARTINRIVVGAGGHVRAPEHLARGSLALAGRGYVPAYADVPRAKKTYDTAENRFVLEFLKQVRALIERVEQLRQGNKTSSTFWSRALIDCGAMRRVLAPFERHDMWNEVQTMDHVPFGSVVLQRRRGYKEVLRHYLTLRSAVRIPLEKDRVASHLLGLKDVATLYELWCYFAVVEAVEQVLRRAPDSTAAYEVKENQVAARRGFVVAWDGGPKVHYNPTFTLGGKEPWGSASLMLRPDVVIEMERDHGPDLHVFDAKLRVDGVAMVSSSDADEDDEAVDADLLKFQKDDVAKMHAYRDALPRVRSARVLYPGHEACEFQALEPGARAGDGVGAIPLVPGQPMVELVRVLTPMIRGDKQVPMADHDDNSFKEPTTSDLAAVADLLADIEAIEAKPGEWHGGKQPDGSIQMPYVVYAPAVERFERALYEHNVIVKFDWPSWQDEAQRFLDPDVVRVASLDDVRRLLTRHVRQDRFVEGHLAEVIASGHVSALLRRLGELVREAAPPRDVLEER